jgi:hypothetical protein
MGEIDEVRFAVAKTMQQMIHDIEAGKYLEWLANHHSRDDEKLPRGAKVVEASESLFRTFGKDEWVQVPDATIGGTKTRSTASSPVSTSRARSGTTSARS